MASRAFNGLFILGRVPPSLCSAEQPGEMPEGGREGHKPGNVGIQTRVGALKCAVRSEELYFKPDKQIASRLCYLFCFLCVSIILRITQTLLTLINALESTTRVGKVLPYDNSSILFSPIPLQERLHKVR